MIRILKGLSFRGLLLLLIFGGGGVIPACSKKSSPSADRPWEKYPEINHDWVKPFFYAYVQSDQEDAVSEQDKVEVPYNKSDTVKNRYILRPQSGKFAALLFNTSNPNSLGMEVDADKTKLDTSSKFTVYNYGNGEWSGYADADNTTNSAYASYLRLVGKDFDTPVKVGDTWYYIMVFKGADGVMYKYTTPTFGVGDAK